MSNLLSREYVADLEIRSDGTGRTVHGILVPYGQVARVSDGGPVYDEAFDRGAFSRDLAARNGRFGGVKMLYQHNRTEPIGRAIDLREDEAGLYGSFAISRTVRGDEALELLRDGVLDSFSIGFRPVSDDIREGVTWRTKAALRETSLVTFPAYSGALVAGVRHLDEVEADEDTTDETSRDDAGPAVPTDPEATGRTEQPTPDPAPAPAAPLGLSPAQRRERLHPNLKESK